MFSHTRVVVVDDHPVVRQGLQGLLAQYPDIEVIGETDGGPETMNVLAALRPDVALVDIRLAEGSGMDLARHMQHSLPRIGIIILSSYDDDAYVLAAAQVGVQAYLLKSTSAEVLADVIRAVHNGQTRLSPLLAEKVLRQLGALSLAQAITNSGLSEQEFQLLKLLADGASTEDMARTLYLSDRTVKRKLQDMLTKLGATSRAQAVAEGFRRGLL